ncbi:MAG: LytR/AlgR family response regulator transcription factor [Asticcacaulis sp.]
MLKVAIVDDEPLAVRRLAALLGKCPDIRIIGTAQSAREAQEIVIAERPDVIFLDIRMPGQNGLQFADGLRQGDMAPEIVFVTAFSRFAVEAFGVAALDYLVKPVEPERLREAIERAKLKKRLKQAVSPQPGVADATGQANSANHRLIFKTANGARFVDIARIDWIRSERDFVHVYTGERTYFFRATLTGLEAKLRAYGFVRVHRSALVALGALEAVLTQGRQCLLITNSGHRIAVSRRLALSVRALAAEAGLSI